MDGHSTLFSVHKLQSGVATNAKLLYFQFWSCSSVPLPNNNNCSLNISSQSTTAHVYVMSGISSGTKLPDDYRPQPCWSTENMFAIGFVL